MSLRILFCNYEYPPLGGGGGVVNAWLAAELATRHEVTVLTSQPRGLPHLRMEEGVRILGAPVLLRWQRSVASLPSMLAFVLSGLWVGRRLLAQERFDVVNTHFVLPTGPVGDALSRWAGIPNVLSLHGGDLYDPSKWTSPHRHGILRLWIRRLLRRADQVVGQSANTLANMRRFYTPELQGVRIPLGIRRVPQGLPPAEREVFGLTSGDVVLVTVGRLVARKAVDQLLRVVAELPAHVHLLVVGDGPQRANLISLAQTLGLQSRVRFLGYVDESTKLRLLKMADLYVSTSQHEGFGLVFLEAMACGLPVLAYDHGGQRDFLLDGRTGYLVPLNRHEQFLRRCRVLVEDGSMRRAMGAFNRMHVERFYIDRCAARYEAVFEQVVQARLQDPAPASVAPSSREPVSSTDTGPRSRG